MDNLTIQVEVMSEAMINNLVYSLVGLLENELLNDKEMSSSIPFESKYKDKVLLN